MMRLTLVLNASFEPLNVIPWKRAVRLMLQNKVEVLEEFDNEIHSLTRTFRVPSVLRLTRYIPISRKKQLIRFSRTNLFLRDRFTCQYCNRSFHPSALTLDHILPLVQGGRTHWENVVTACKPCNQRKGGRTPTQAAMKLLAPAARPQWLPAVQIQMTLATTPEAWKGYIENALFSAPLPP